MLTMDIFTTLILFHIIGTVLGVGAATFIEIFTLYLLSQGDREPMKHMLLQISYNTLRIGLLLLVLSGMGFLVHVRILGFGGYIEMPLFWVKMGVVAVLVAAAMLQQLKLISMTWGSAIALTSWYTALAFGVFLEAEASIPMAIAWYVVAVIAMYFVFSYLHKKFSKQAPENVTP